MNIYLKPTIFRVLKLSTLCLILGVEAGFATESYSQKTTFTISVQDQSVKDVFDYIEQHSEFIIFYLDKTIDVNRKVSINLKGQRVESILEQLFKNTDVTYTINDRQILLSKRKEVTEAAPVVAVVQQKKNTVTGVVLDPTGMPVIGANIMVKGTTSGTITDMDGKFSLDVDKDATLVISYIGFASQEIKVGNQTKLSIALKEDSKALDDLVVVGYTAQRRELLTGSVASMKVTEELKNVPSTSPADILAGQLSGVNVSTGDGLPGNQSSISIRAKSSWNSQDVLYVIDGIISSVTDFNNLSSNEIDNVTVLKDAASAAIYGSRAAGGVVVVTTKGGTYGQKVKIEYSFNTGFSKRGKNAELTDAAQTAEMYMRVNPTSDPASWAWTPEEIEWIKTVNGGWGYDLVDAVWQDPQISTHNIGITGGSEKVKFYAGGSFTKQDGFLENLWYKKNNYRLNISAKISKDLEIFGSLSLQHTKKSSVTGSSAGDVYGLYQWLLGWQPDDPIWTDGGLPIDPSWNANVAAQVRGDAGYIHDNFLKPTLNIKATYKIPFVKGLSLIAGFSKSYTNSRNKTYQKKYKMYVTKKEGTHKVSTKDEDIIGVSTSSQISNDYLEESSNWGDSWQYNIQLSYDKVFRDVHNLKATLVFEKQETNTGGMLAGVQNFPVYNTDNWWATSADRMDSYISNSSSLTDQGVGRQSWIGQLLYDYNGKYLFSASYRYDGSMNFAPKYRWGFFPSGSIGWILSKEPFFNISQVDLLKLRASIGLTGNDAVGGWQWQQLYRAGNSAYFGTDNAISPGITYGVLPNEKLTWEKSLTYNVGLDLGFLSDFTLSGEYYYTNTYDILGARSLAVPPTFSLELPAENYGEVHAQGVEFSLGYQHKFGDFNFNGGLVLSYANANYIKYDDDKVTYDYQKRVGRSLTAVYGFLSDGIIRTEEDLERFNKEHPGYNFKGIVPELGQLVYKDVSGPKNIPDGIIDDYDQVILLDNNNPIVMGITVGGEWKGFALSAVFNGCFKQEKFMRDLFEGNEWDRTWVGSYYGSWTLENPNSEFPKRIHVWNPYKTYSQNSDFWLKKSNYMRLKNLNLSYTLPVKLYEKMGIDRVQVYFTGSNLFVISPFNKKYYDPEIGSGKTFPIMKSYNFGINITL